ncbi:MAG TPA: response regulator, partial [Thermodesulfobacteriota bacterium]|nr:response regulator [Thermodesulfobacteriota bacterium]
MESKLQDKTILIVDDEPDILALLEEEIKEACPNCRVIKAETYEWAVDLLNSTPYDLVILDIMGVRGFDLLTQAVNRNYPVVMLTAHALSPETLKKAIEQGARAYLPKDKIGAIVPFLEDVLTHEPITGWRRLFERMGDYFSRRFGPDWQQTDEPFWKDFNEKLKTDGTS